MPVSPYKLTSPALSHELKNIWEEIDARVQKIRDVNPQWPCVGGCGGCCQRLANDPLLTQTEWDILYSALQALDESVLNQITLRVSALATSQKALPINHGGVTCPLLDRDSNLCSVYPSRPVACRTYGFYAQKRHGLYCDEIDRKVADATFADVIWGNQESIDRRLHALGEQKTLTEWFLAAFS